MSNLQAGLNRLSYQLGAMIDPVGHAADERKFAINRNCPTCFAEPGLRCETKTGNVASRPHNNR